MPTELCKKKKNDNIHTREAQESDGQTNPEKCWVTAHELRFTLIQESPCKVWNR